LGVQGAIVVDSSVAASDSNWWGDPWWEQAEYQTESGLSLQEIRSTVDALKSLFNAPWTSRALQAGAPNAVLAILYGGRGLWPFQSLMELGRIAMALRDVPTVRRPLAELNGQKSRSALFELEVASWFIEDSWEVEFMAPEPGHRTPDLSITKDGVSSDVECKRLEPDQWEEWASALSMDLIQRVNSCTNPQSPCFEIVLEPRLSDLRQGDGAISDALRSEIVDQVAAAAQRALSGVPLRSIVVPGIAEIRLRTDREPQCRISQLGTA
jgi:hypothetical protein